MWAGISQDRKTTFCQLFHFGLFCLSLVTPLCPAPLGKAPTSKGQGLTHSLRVCDGLGRVNVLSPPPWLLPPLCHTHAAVGPCGPAPTTAEGRFSWDFLLRLGHRPPEAELGRNRGKHTFCSKWHLTERSPHTLPSTWIPTHPPRRLGATTSGLESTSPDTPGHAVLPRGSRELPAS